MRTKVAAKQLKSFWLVPVAAMMQVVQMEQRVFAFVDGPVSLVELMAPHWVSGYLTYWIRHWFEFVVDSWKAVAQLDSIWHGMV